MNTMCLESPMYFHLYDIPAKKAEAADHKDIPPRSKILKSWFTLLTISKARSMKRTEK